MLCAFILHISGGTYSFKIDSERQVFWETLHANSIYFQSFRQKSADRKSPQKYFLYFVLTSGLGFERWLLSQRTA